MLNRVIVCGGRDFSDKELCFESLDRILSRYSGIEIITGHARGADSLGEEYAVLNGYRLSVFSPDWKKYGKSAGPIRNSDMLAYALLENPVVIAFWDGKSEGTKDMIKKAEQARADLFVIRY